MVRKGLRAAPRWEEAAGRGGSRWRAWGCKDVSHCSAPGMGCTWAGGTLPRPAGEQSPHPVSWTCIPEPRGLRETGGRVALHVGHPSMSIRTLTPERCRWPRPLTSLSRNADPGLLPVSSLTSARTRGGGPISPTAAWPKACCPRVQAPQTPGAERTGCLLLFPGRRRLPGLSPW